MDNLQEANKPILFMKALYSFSKRKENELSFKKGDVLLVIEQDQSSWWKGSPSIESVS
jgi:hypothetical protein